MGIFIYQFGYIYIIIFITLTAFFFHKKFYLILYKNKIFDLNEKNKNHLVASGYGIFFIFLIFILTLLVSFKYINNLTLSYVIIPFSIIFLGIIGFLDDYKSVSVILRLFLFFSTVYLSLGAFGTENLNFLHYPRISIFIIIVSWVYFINCSNFLDGGDEYLINAYLPLFGFLCCYYLFYSFNDLFFLYNYTAIIFLLFFRKYNLYPSKMFMGDAGSLSLGYLFFFNVLKIFEKEQFIIATILLLYFFSDVTITLVTRIYLKKNIFSRHRGFFIHVANKLKIKTKIISKYIFFINFFYFLNLILILFFEKHVYLLLFLCIAAQLFYLLLLIKFKIRNFITNQ